VFLVKPNTYKTAGRGLPYEVALPVKEALYSKQILLGIGYHFFLNELGDRLKKTDRIVYSCFRNVLISCKWIKEVSFWHVYFIYLFSSDGLEQVSAKLLPLTDSISSPIWEMNEYGYGQGKLKRWNKNLFQYLSFSDEYLMNFSRSENRWETWTM